MAVRTSLAVRSSLVGIVAALIAPALAPSGAATAAPIVAQINFGHLLDTGKDLAVRSALSAFGKSVSGQLPIVVDPADAYPTVATLPGAPFAPVATANLAPMLRASADGTAELPPGDYSFPVSVFCMRASAHSPNGHRYLVAPLHGSAADIITALDSRAPSYPTDHSVLQVLSWDIQAGLPYAAMQPSQRAAVDRIIPEYRGRLSGDVLTQIHAEYDRSAGSVPGMPSFEGALGRIGPVGDAVVTLENVRRQLAQPPPTFAELARALVPDAPFVNTASHATSVASDTGGPTPWSRYSDRVFVRFTTSGNYATPGTYDVRVLPPDREQRTRTVRSALGNSRDGAKVALSAGAAVPFGNIVNNPGTAAVQPLTQVPLPSAAAPRANPNPNPRPSPTPTPTLAIESETVATVPADRARTLVGVGEVVHLTLVGAKGSARWTISTSIDSRVFPASGREVSYYAGQQATGDVITAYADGKSASIVFNVIEPAGVRQVVDPAFALIHTQGLPDVGFRSVSYLTPDTVSFENIGVKELEVCASATGVFEPSGHLPFAGYHQIVSVVPGLGSKVQGEDVNYSGFSGEALYRKRLHLTFPPGSKVFQIPWVYAMRTGSPDHKFATVTSKISLLSDGQTVVLSKAGASATTRIDAPSINLDKRAGSAEDANDQTVYASPCDPQF